jgi:hypothetical protein
MSTTLTEDEMRQALFGSAAPQKVSDVDKAEIAKPVVREQVTTSTAPRRRATGRVCSSKLRVTLHVTKEFEGPVEVFVYDADTLSTLMAEQEAKSAAKKKKFKYFEVVSIRAAQ